MKDREEDDVTRPVPTKRRASATPVFIEGRWPVVRLEITSDDQGNDYLEALDGQDNRWRIRVGRLYE